MKKILTLLIFLVFFIIQLTKAQAPADTIGAGRALQFNGNLGNYVDLGDVYKNLNFPFTFEAWIYPTGLQPNSKNPNDGIFATDNNPDAYYGFLIEIYGTTDPSPGSLFIDFGNGGGYGYQYRRGFYTANSLPLYQWSHIAIECNSVTDVTFYINGVVQTIVADDGTSTSTTLTYSSSHTNLGRRDIGGTEDNFIGQIDEARLWNIDLSQAGIQQNMCSKITGNPDGLIGYWKCDEADTSNTVYDYSGNGINGTIIDTVTRVLSNAAIGNASTYLYTGDYSGASLQLGSATGDSLLVDQVTGLPDGVQLYAVNSVPFDITGLKSKPTSYFGVFPVNGASPTYSIAYKYSLTDGTVNIANQDSVSLSRRPYTSFLPWLDANGILNTNQKLITQTGLSSQQEFAIDVPQISTGIDQLTVDNGQLSIYPNPSNGDFTVTSTKNIDEVKVYNVIGQLVYEAQPKQAQFTFELNSDGLYFVTVTSGNKTSTGKIVVSK